MIRFRNKNTKDTWKTCNITGRKALTFNFYTYEYMIDAKIYTEYTNAWVNAFEKEQLWDALKV